MQKLLIRSSAWFRVPLGTKLRAGASEAASDAAKRAVLRQFRDSMKTRKSITKRFKITRTGKVLRRLTGQDHYLAKKTGKRRRARRKWVEMSKAEAKKIKKLTAY